MTNTLPLAYLVADTTADFHTMRALSTALVDKVAVETPSTCSYPGKELSTLNSYLVPLEVQPGCF